MSVAKRENRSLNKIAYAILDKYSGGRPSSDNSIPIDLIKYEIINVRELLLRQDMNKARSLNLHAEQSLGCVEMELVDESECCDYDTGCKILRSKKQIPDPLRLRWRSGITYVGSINGKHYYPGSTPYKSRWRNKGRFVRKDQTFHFILNNYVYLLNDLKSEVISVRMIASDPKQTSRFHTCEGETCYTDDDPFPVPGDMIPRIESFVEDRLMRQAVSTPEDQETDLQDGNNRANINS